MPVYRRFCSCWPRSLLLSFCISVINVFLFIRNVFFFSLLISGGSFAYQIVSERVSIHLDELGSTFLPSPTSLLIWPSFCFPCPSPIAKKNNPIMVGSWHNQIKMTQLVRKTWKGSPKVWIALHRELNIIKIKCTPSQTKVPMGSCYPHKD